MKMQSLFFPAILQSLHLVPALVVHLAPQEAVTRWKAFTSIGRNPLMQAQFRLQAQLIFELNHTQRQLFKVNMIWNTQTSAPTLTPM